LYEAQIAAAKAGDEEITSPNLLTWMGRKLAARGDWDGADAAYRMSFERAPAHATYPIETAWWRAGPFEAIIGDDLPTDIEFDPFKTAAKGGDSDRSWRQTRSGSVFRSRTSKPALQYALKHVWSPDDREVTFILGDDDQIWLFVNEALLFKSEKNGNGYTRPEHIVPVALRAGWNTVLIKVLNTVGKGGVMCKISDDPQVIGRAKRATMKPE
jgi:hypothetical protein